MSLSSRLAVAIVAAELDGLAETLASARSFATQVVVGVHQETPETGLIARSSGAQVVELPLGTSAAGARNACLAKITASWILWLEPGERIIATGIDALEELLAESCPHDRAYRCLVCTPGLGAHATTECRAETRLHPRLAGAKFTGMVRESVDDSLQAAGCQIETLNLRIERPLSPTEEARRERRAKRLLKQLDVLLAQKPRTPKTLNALGEALQIVGDTVQAAERYREALELASERSADQLEAWYGLLTSLDGTPNARSAQLQLCMQALESFPVDAQLLCALGGYLQALGHQDLSTQAYHVAWKHGQIVPAVEHLEDIREIAAACRVAGLLQLGEADEAQRFAQLALAKDPDSDRLKEVWRSLMSQNDASRKLRLDAAGPVRSASPKSAATSAPKSH